MRKYPVIVESAKGSVNFNKFKLSSLGLRRRDHDSFDGYVSESQYRKIENFCVRKKLKYHIDNQFGKRNSTYREDFFKTNPPAIGDKYFCAYCGFLYPKKKITVDHIIPVGKAKKDLRTQKRLSFIGIKDINDTRNLVAACERCNKSKGKNTDGWILKGVIGRYRWLWVIRWFIRVALLVLIVTALVYSVVFDGVNLEIGNIASVWRAILQ